jgi:hypothetical protein
MLKRPVGRPSNDVRRFHANFAFQMDEVAIPRQMFQEILQLIAELRPQPRARASMRHRCSCVQEQLTGGVRLLRGEPLDLVARQTNVSVAKLTEWRDRALAGAATALKERERDDRDDEIARLKSTSRRGARLSHNNATAIAVIGIACDRKKLPSTDQSILSQPSDVRAETRVPRIGG